jgi:O-antigen ligase
LKLVNSRWKIIELGIVILFLLISENISLPLLRKIPGSGQYAMLALLLLSLFIMGQGKRLIYVATIDKFLLFLVALCVLSAFWSAAPNFTLDEVKAMIRTTLFGVYLATRYTPREQMYLFAGVCAIAALLSLQTALMQPSIGISGTGMWKGIYAHKQYLGRMMVLASMVFTLISWESRKYRWVALFFLALSLALVLLSQSKTSLVLLLLALSILPLSQIVKSNYKLQVFLISLVLVLGGSLSMFFISNLETIVVDKLGKDMTFNGRLPVWQLVIEKGMKRPLLGYGFSGFWTSDESVSIINSTWAGDTSGRSAKGFRFHSHNGFVDLFIELGFLGLVTFFIHFIIVLLRTVKLITISKSLEYFFMLEILLIMFLFNGTETKTILSTGNILWVFYSSIACSTAIQVNRINYIMKFKAGNKEYMLNPDY